MASRVGAPAAAASLAPRRAWAARRVGAAPGLAARGLRLPAVLRRRPPPVRAPAASAAYPASQPDWQARPAARAALPAVPKLKNGGAALTSPCATTQAPPRGPAPAPKLDDGVVRALRGAMEDFVLGRGNGSAPADSGPLTPDALFELAAALVPPLLSAVDGVAPSAALEQLLGVVAAVNASPPPNARKAARAATGGGGEQDEAEGAPLPRSPARPAPSSPQRRPEQAAAAALCLCLRSAGFVSQLF